MSRRILPVPALLDSQFGEFPRRSVPPELESTLFAPGAETYAIIDAGRVAMFDAETLAQGAPFACLLGGEAVEKLGNWAAWIFRLGKDDRLTRQLFTMAQDGRGGLWPLRSAVFLRSTENLETLRSHLRRFTQIPDEAGKRYFLRFYCPDALPVILGHLENDGARRERWYRHRGKTVVESYWIPDPDAPAMIVHHHDDTPPAHPANIPFQLDAAYRHIMAEIRRIQQRRKIADAVLLSEGNAHDLSAHDWHRIVDATIDAAWTAGVGPERAMAYIAMGALTRGRAVSAEEISRILQLPDSPGQQTERARRFAEGAEQAPVIHDDWVLRR